MADRLFMIALSPTMEEGTILKWKVKEGDTFEAGTPLCEVETDKASMDYEAAEDGTLLKIIMGEGDGAKVGDTIAIFGEAGEDYAELLAEIETESAAPAPAAPAAETKAEPESAKEAPAPAPKASAPSSPGPSAPATSGGKVKASPLAKKIAEQKGYDITQIPGSGPGGRVVKADVEGFTPSAAASTSFAPNVLGGSALNDERIAVSRKRQVIAKRLGESKFQAPHFYLKLSIGMDDILDARAKLNKKLPNKVGLNAFMIKFVAEAIKRHQEINSSWEGDFIQNHASIDIGLAVAQPDGLITPIVKNCGAKGIVQIDNELKYLIDRARTNALSPEEYTGATFTISNLGSFGIEEFTAIINPPGVAILALGATVPTPIVDEDGELIVRKQMKVSLSCDHRVIDGAVGAKFLKDLKDMMEDPFQVLF
jgi:pyruvate dehydrogenase E2 component (dihydrolipoamide acetyltransferase)